MPQFLVGYGCPTARERESVCVCVCVSLPFLVHPSIRVCVMGREGPRRPTDTTTEERNERAKEGQRRYPLLWGEGGARRLVYGPGDASSS